MVGIQWSWICSTITNHRKMNTLYEWKVHATIPVAGISSEDAWERYQTNYMESLNEPEAFWTAVSSDHFFCFFDRLQILFNGYLWLSWRAFGNLNQGIFNHVASEQLCIMDLSLQESSGWILHRRYICKTWSWPTHRSQSQDVANILLMVIRYRPIVKLIFPHFTLLRRWSELVHWRQAERLLQLHRQASAPQSGSDCNYLGWRWDRYQ